MSAIQDLIDFETKVADHRFGYEESLENTNYANMVRIAAVEYAVLQARVAELEMALSQIASGDGQYGQQAGEYKAIARKVLENYS